MADKTTSPPWVWRGNKKPAYAKGYGAVNKPAYAKGYGAVNKNDPPSPTTYAKATAAALRAMAVKTAVKRLRWSRGYGGQEGKTR